MKLSDRQLGWCFGFALLAVYAALILAIGLGKVEEKTSFGMVTVVNGLLLVTEKYGAWMWRVYHPAETKQEGQ